MNAHIQYQKSKGCCGGRCNTAERQVAALARGLNTRKESVTTPWDTRYDPPLPPKKY